MPGTGIMGAATAQNLVKSGYAVRVWNRSRDKAEALDIPVANDFADAGRHRASRSGTAAGTIWVQSTTTSLGDVTALAAFAIR